MNNTRNRVLIFLVIILLLTNVGMLIYFTSGNKMPSRGPRADRRGPGITAFLQNEDGFTPAQMQQFDSLKTQHRAAIKPLFDELGKSKDRFYQLLGKANVSDSTLKAAADEIGQRQAALDLQFYKNFMSIRSLCTPEQLPKFDSVMPSLTSRMMQPWQKKQPSRGGRGDSSNQKNK